MKITLITSFKKEASHKFFPVLNYTSAQQSAIVCIVATMTSEGLTGSDCVIQLFIVIQGLTYTKDRDANSLAEVLAQHWVYANHKGYLDSNEMFEKVRIQYFFFIFIYTT
jgi:hypothetical protein